VLLGASRQKDMGVQATGPSASTPLSRRTTPPPPSAAATAAATAAAAAVAPARTRRAVSTNTGTVDGSIRPRVRRIAGSLSGLAAQSLAAEGWVSRLRA
jgi:hypothetical protein